MISNPILCAGLTGIFLALSATVWAQEAATRVGIGDVEIEGDPRHTSTMLPGRGVRKERDTPFIAAEVAVQDAAIFKRIFNLDLFLHRIRVPTADAIGPQVLRALEEDDIHFFMVD